MITQRRLEKPVLHSRLLDAMETLDAWEHHGEGSMTLATHLAKEGTASVHLRSNTFTASPSPSGRPSCWCTNQSQFRRAFLAFG
jgi:hypothetical protein